jgi:hypothetical protein
MTTVWIALGGVSVGMFLAALAWDRAHSRKHEKPDGTPTPTYPERRDKERRKPTYA